MKDIAAAISLTTKKRHSALIGIQIGMQNGFSLAEVMVASFILFASVTASVTLFNLTNTNSRLGEEKQDEQAAISEDLATIIKINDQYKCLGSNNCAAEDSYPNENEYISSNQSDLDDICTANDQLSGFPGSGFAALLVSAINQQQISTRLSNLKIKRNASVAKNNPPDAPPHLYSVEWTDSAGTLLRKVTLLPTVAAWCP